MLVCNNMKIRIAYNYKLSITHMLKKKQTNVKITAIYNKYIKISITWIHKFISFNPKTSF